MSWIHVLHLLWVFVFIGKGLFIRFQKAYIYT